ncbi:hypothetical protein BKA61DRAFT_723336 [Leptodontidium sp. MPI-SDFR-AT-0119]|nr:hypothetical protein BKA61DRAFT_723336 [Leptodontidium sp. MPI-SDFR-AT-0119]
MTLPEMADALQALSLSDPEYLLFNPNNESAWLQEKFDDIPRYLFRVFTPKSRGTTNESWTKSMDATDRAQNSRVDIFARENKKRVASMPNRHLQWWRGCEDNLISWTSSLLFTLVYIFHLRANSNDRSTFDDIYLCALKIEGKCRIVSAQAMIDRGLCDLRHEFEEFSHWSISLKPPRAKPVVELRNVLYQMERSEKSDGKLRITLDITQVFGSRWTLPMAANLGDLVPTLEEDIIVRAFKANFLTDDDRENSPPLKTKVRAYGSLPEVEQFGKIMRDVYKNFCVEKLRSKLSMAD